MLWNEKINTRIFSMNTILTARFCITTPMFLGGADPTTEAELRPASIKGALRFWWRALMWSCGAKDIFSLHKEEGSIFGSSDSGQSRVLMRLEKTLCEGYSVSDRWPPASWQHYTGYGLRDNGERRFLKPGQHFSVFFGMQRCSDEQRGQVVSAVFALGLLGGLGARSRKGWGSITLTEFDGEKWTCPDSDKEWMKAVKSLFGSNIKDAAPYSAFTSKTLFNCGPMQKSAAAAQEWLGNRYHVHVKDTFPKSDRSQFGLPRNFNSDAKGTRPRKERRASPLFLHIHQCPSGKALPAALWLPSDFLPGEPDISGDGKSARDFIDYLPSRIEVIP
jgi:CRISPR-associated protein Cmr1